MYLAFELVHVHVDLVEVVVVHGLAVVFHHVPAFVGLELAVRLQVLLVLVALVARIDDTLERLAVPSEAPRLLVQRHADHVQRHSLTGRNLERTNEPTSLFVCLFVFFLLGSTNITTSELAYFDRLHVERYGRVLWRTVLQIGQVVVQALLELEHLYGLNGRVVQVVLDLDALAVDHVAQCERVLEHVAVAASAYADEAIHLARRVLVRTAHGHNGAFRFA